MIIILSWEKKDFFLSYKDSTSPKQDEIVKSAKNAIKPYYVGNKINKDEYKYIMKRVVCKTLEHLKESKAKKIDDSKISRLIDAYVKTVRDKRSL